MYSRGKTLAVVKDFLLLRGITFRLAPLFEAASEEMFLISCALASAY